MLYWSPSLNILSRHPCDNGISDSHTPNLLASHSFTIGSLLLFTYVTNTIGLMWHSFFLHLLFTRLPSFSSFLCYICFLCIYWGHFSSFPILMTCSDPTGKIAFSSANLMRAVICKYPGGIGRENI